MVFKSLIAMFLSFFQSNEFIEDLGPLIEPTAVSFSFDTLGWRVSIIFFIIAMLLTVFLKISKYVKNKYRRMAVNDLLAKVTLSNLENYHKVNYANMVLKKVAIEVYGRQDVAKMFGSQWLQFLDSKCKKSQLSQLEIVFKNSCYNLKPITDSEFDLVMEGTKKWIHQHAR